MKYITLLVLVFSASTFGYSQPVVATFDRAESMNISFAELDSLYPSAIHTDTSKAVFSERQDKFIDSYRSMMQKLGNFLHKNNFEWGERTTFFQRIYFNRDGKIDYYFINLRKTGFSEAKKEQLKKLLTNFSDNYKISLSTDMDFAQCSPVTFVDPKSNKEQKK